MVYEGFNKGTLKGVSLGCLGAVLVAAGLFSAAGSARASTDPGQRSTPLPETEGVQGLVVNRTSAFVVWADAPLGHSAAVNDTTGQVAWHTTTAESADLIAAGNGVVWTAQNYAGSSLVEQQGSTGRTLARLTAPGQANWSSIAATGPYLYGFTAGAQDKVLTVYDGAHMVRRVTTGLPSDESCHSVVGGASLYLACFGPTEDSVYRISTRTGRVLAHSAAMTLDGGESTLAYQDGSLYVVTSAETNTQPATVVRLDPATLKVDAVSVPLDVQDISTTGTEVLVLVTAGNSSPGSVVALNSTTLSQKSSTSIDSPGAFPTSFAASAHDAYVVEVTSYSQNGPVEALIQVPLS